LHRRPVHNHRRLNALRGLLRRLGENKLPDPSVREQLNSWIAAKKGSVSEATLVGYEQARGLLLEFLGNRADRSVGQFTKKDVVAFRDRLRSEGRTEHGKQDLQKIPDWTF
jgi:hypothetical protein